MRSEAAEVQASWLRERVLRPGGFGNGRRLLFKLHFSAMSKFIHHFNVQGTAFSPLSFSLSLSLQSSSQSSTFVAQEDARKHIFELIWITMACH